MKKGFFVRLFACMFWFCFLFFLEGCLHVFSVLFSVLRSYRASTFTFYYLQLFSPSLSAILSKEISLYLNNIYTICLASNLHIRIPLWLYIQQASLFFFFFLSCAHSRVISSPVLTTTKMHIFLGFILSFSLFQLSISLKLFLLCCLFLNVTMISTCLQKIECQTFCLPY